MEEIEIDLANVQRAEKIEYVIESVCNAQGLQLAAKGTLQKYPGCIHWHYGKEKTTGTLERTYWPSQNRGWLPLRGGRAKPWVIEMANVLKTEIERQVRS